MKPKVSIVLVNYNGNEDTLKCIESLRHVEYDNFEVIVVDNASEMQKEMEAALPEDVILIKSDQNRGFSGGNNLGIEFAVKNETDYILLLNNDTVVEADFLTELIETASRHKDVGIITGKILYFSKPNYIWYAGGYMNLNKARIHHMHIQEKDDFPDCEKLVSFATGCLMMVPRNIINEVGGLNELFFMYSEDAEYCARIQNAGYKIIYTPKAKIYHKVGASSGGAGSKLSQYYRSRNEMYLVIHFAKHKILGAFCCFIRFLKRIMVKQFTLGCCLAGLIDLCTGRMGKTERDL